jgi:hypothetical protein
MLKRYVTLLAMIGLVVLVPSAPARGLAKRKHQCTNTSRAATLEQDSEYPNVGTSAETAGVFDETCDGGKLVTHGASEFRITITDISMGNAVSSVNASAGSQAAPVIKFRTEGTSYSDRGTLKMTSTGTATPQANGSISYSGESKITSGTRLYRGATGGGTYSGSLTANGTSTQEGTSTETY